MASNQKSRNTNAESSAESSAETADELLEGIGQSLQRFGDATELLQKVLDTIPQTVFWKDPNLNYLGCNKLFAQHAGKSKPIELIGLDDFDLPWGREEAEFYRLCDRRVMDSGQAEIGIIESQVNAQGELTWLETNKVPLHNDDGDVIGILGTYHDITALKQAEETLQRNNEELEIRVEERTRELQFVAHHDSLTGLANRRHFINQLDGILNSSENEKIGLMFIDLDNFKPINDSEGHEAGDQMLIQVAEILQSTLGSRDFAGRLGGDEFLIFFRDVDKQRLESVCESIRMAMKNNIEINGRKTMVTASIGIVHGDSARYSSSVELVHDSDLAMYAAKGQGKNSISFFAESMRHTTNFQLSIEHELIKGISENQFLMYYQPIIDLNKNSVCEFEALARWQHPQHGLMLPEEFISKAESLGVMHELGKKIIESSCRQLAQWKNEAESRADELMISINLSPCQLYATDFEEHVRDTIADLNLRPRDLCFEISESFVLLNPEHAIEFLIQLRKQEFKLVLDDFGTGYSALSYLDELPLDMLKIDRSFVAKLETNAADNAIIRMIIALAETLGIRAVAVGVANLNQRKILESMNCTQLQGDYFAKPMTAADATEYLLNGHWAGSHQKS